MQANYQAEKPLGYVQGASIDSATLINSLTFQGQSAAGIPPGTVLLRIIPEAQAIRWRDDGTAPTTTVGQPLAVGAELQYTARGMNALQVISQVAGAKVNVVAYGQGTP